MEFISVSFLSFIFITTITPGPNNISSASMGMLFGYRKTLNYLLGIVSGFFLLLFACAVLSSSLMHYAPWIQQYLKYVGAIYIVWLAYKTFNSSYTANQNGTQLASYSRGLFLQVVNPKGLFYGLTIFTTFLVGANEYPLLLLIWTIFLALVCFFSVSVWALFGALIQRYMKNEKAKMFINAILSLALVYTALDILGWMG
ncbi:cysteine/O-acetylserine efflux protein [Reichenbachiella faecimaris]|uniref:Cysteine/O-acetylserine efflux protein n=1 Tax=Reichenbachiella faecimaris TaxID=692418 RepID=A0A1W2G6Z3_REIFA|nr:LysE family translocator [Reichenbachiella faecimaris]SMD32076.1 cysteine/O-acetylserine efflux protein [Reichenbachiella faecimaris]